MEYTFDAAATRARQEQASKNTFTKWKETSAPDPVKPSDSAPVTTTYADPIPSPTRTRGYSASANSSRYYTPSDYEVSSRPIRVRRMYTTYYSRPVVVYNDPYSSYFWWWLLDQSLDSRAQWAYNHRYDMDPTRYQTLMAEENLAGRVHALESQQLALNSNFTPNGMEQDLMYSDQNVQSSYHTRPTPSGKFMFWLIMIPAGLGGVAFMAWLVFVKRWYTSS